MDPRPAWESPIKVQEGVGASKFRNPASRYAMVGVFVAKTATGVRVGWSFGPKAVIDKMKAILTHIGAWAPMAEQKARNLRRS